MVRGVVAAIMALRGDLAGVGVLHLNRNRRFAPRPTVHNPAATAAAHEAYPTTVPDESAKRRRRFFFRRRPLTLGLIRGLRSGPHAYGSTGDLNGALGITRNIVAL